MPSPTSASPKDNLAQLQAAAAAAQTAAVQAAATAAAQTAANNAINQSTVTLQYYTADAAGQVGTLDITSLIQALLPGLQDAGVVLRTTASGTGTSMSGSGSTSTGTSTGTGSSSGSTTTTPAPTATLAIESGNDGVQHTTDFTMASTEDAVYLFVTVPAGATITDFQVMAPGPAAGSFFANNGKNQVDYVNLAAGTRGNNYVAGMHTGTYAISVKLTVNGTALTTNVLNVTCTKA